MSQNKPWVIVDAFDHPLVYEVDTDQLANVGESGVYTSFPNSAIASKILDDIAAKNFHVHGILPDETKAAYHIREEAESDKGGVE